MNGVAQTFGIVLEAIRPWLSPVALLAILGVVTRHYREVRRANTADRQLDVNAEGSLRDAYASAVRGFREEVAALKENNRAEIADIKDGHRKDMKEMERRNRECDEDRELLRKQVDALKDHVAGLNRVILQASADKVLALGDFPSEDVRRAAERVDQLFKKHRMKKHDPS